MNRKFNNWSSGMLAIGLAAAMTWLCVGLMGSGLPQAAAQQAEPFDLNLQEVGAPEYPYTPDRLIVKFRSGLNLRNVAGGTPKSGKPAVDRLFASQGVQQIRPMASGWSEKPGAGDLGFSRMYVLDLQRGPAWAAHHTTGFCKGDPMNILLYMYIGAGLLLAVLAIPLMLGKVPPNPLYGMRTSVTLSDPKLWYPANRYAGKWLFAIGILVVAAAVGLYLIPGLSVDAYALACLAVFVLAFGLALWRSFVYLKSLQKE